MKYVVYLDARGQTRVTPPVAHENIRSINAVWKQCNIAFQIDKYVAIRPSDFNLQYQTSDYADLTDIRHTFSEETTLLLVSTGAWNRGGSGRLSGLRDPGAEDRACSANPHGHAAAHAG